MFKELKQKKKTITSINNLCSHPEDYRLEAELDGDDVNVKIIKKDNITKYVNKSQMIKKEQSECNYILPVVSSFAIGIATGIIIGTTIIRQNCNS